ncbi:MAG TPA: hypothetical protein ENH53_05300 [Bacteroidetes bacterium]|nr:hypothetical protein [Bacteroidota bacterium]HDZ11613.1 hypothetical protein [Bacteroidota bacterium]
MTLKKIVKGLFLIGMVLISAEISRAQDFNPPFPRIGQITFYPAGAGPTIWKNHNMVIIRHYYPDDAKRIKEKNPDVILLAANDALEGNIIKNITGKPLPDEWYIHYADGSKVPFWGGYMTNLSNECPVANYIYGPQRFNQFLAKFLIENTDWNYFDGSLFDTWFQRLKWFVKNLDNVDLDGDGKPDGASIAEERWEKGKKTLVENMRALSPKPILAFESGETYLNGNGFEFWTQETVASRAWNMQKALDLLKNAVSPQMNYANSEAKGYGAVFRADFTSAQIVGAFFGHDEGTYAHRWTFLHDEYEAKLGYPTDPPQTLEENLWIRYYDTGVIISNISGQTKTVSASQLHGGPYWRFQGQQDPVFNNGKKFDTVTLQPIDGIMLFKQPVTLITPIVIDNVPKNMTSLGQNPVDYQGTWTQQDRNNITTDNPAYALFYGWGDFASPYAFSSPGNGENIAHYNPVLSVSGYYEILEWHGWHGKYPNDYQEASNVPYRILINNAPVHSGTIDQTKNYGKWNSLGIYYISKGAKIDVSLTNKANGIVISDAIEFVYKGSKQNQDTTPPAAPRNVKINP